MGSYRTAAREHRTVVTEHRTVVTEHRAAIRLCRIFLSTYRVLADVDARGSAIAARGSALALTKTRSVAPCARFGACPCRPRRCSPPPRVARPCAVRVSGGWTPPHGELSVRERTELFSLLFLPLPLRAVMSVSVRACVVAANSRTSTTAPRSRTQIHESTSARRVVAPAFTHTTRTAPSVPSLAELCSLLFLHSSSRAVMFDSPRTSVIAAIVRTPITAPRSRTQIHVNTATRRVVAPHASSVTERAERSPSLSFPVPSALCLVPHPPPTHDLPTPLAYALRITIVASCPPR